MYLRLPNEQEAEGTPQDMMAKIMLSPKGLSDRSCYWGIHRPPRDGIGVMNSDQC